MQYNSEQRTVVKIAKIIHYRYMGYDINACSSNVIPKLYVVGGIMLSTSTDVVGTDFRVLTRNAHVWSTPLAITELSAPWG